MASIRRWLKCRAGIHCNHPVGFREKEVVHGLKELANVDLYWSHMVHALVQRETVFLCCWCHGLHKVGGGKVRLEEVIFPNEGRAATIRSIIHAHKEALDESS